MHANGSYLYARRGFTLIELLCVVLILAIAAAIVLPQLGSRGDLKAAAGARQIMADLTFAQNRAIATQTPQYVSFNVASQTYSVQEGTPPATETNPVTQQPYSQAFGSSSDLGLQDVTLVSAAFDSVNCLAFDELGAPYSYNGGSMTSMGAGQIRISSDGYVLTLNVQPYTGDVTVQGPQ